MNTTFRMLGLAALAVLCIDIPMECHAMKTTPEQRKSLRKGAKPCRIDKVARPRILMSAERLAALREEVLTTGVKRTIYNEGVRKNAGLWLNRTISIPARAGHAHEFFCNDGTRLELPDDQQPYTTGTFRCPACGRGYSGEPYESARRNHDHAWLMTACRDLAIVAAVENSAQCAAKAAEILVKYADAYPGRHTAHAGADAGGIYWQSLDESMHIMPLAQAYDLIHDMDVLTPGQKEHIEYDLFWECAEGLVKMGATSNWGSWHLSATGLIGLATGHQRFIDHGVKSLQKQLSTELGEDGLWPESVHTYHFFPLGAMLMFAEGGANCGIDLYGYKAKDGRGLEKMLEAPLHYMYPDMRLPAINDGWYDAYLPSEVYELGYARYKRPEFAWAAEQVEKLVKTPSSGWRVNAKLFSLVIGQPHPSDPPPPSFKSIDFPVLGIAIVRHGQADPAMEFMMTFDYGPMLGHGQPDKMGITLFANGRVLAADYGTPGYGSGILPYYKGTISHNTVMVDGKNQEATKDRRLVVFADKPEVKAACAQTDEAYPGTGWRRTVLLADEYSLVIDELDAEGIREFDWLLHAEGRYDVARGEYTDRVESMFAHEYVSEVHAFAPQDGVYEARWRLDDGSGLNLVAACPDETMAFRGLSPAQTGARRVPLTVLRQHGRQARFAVLLQPYAANDADDKGAPKQPWTLAAEEGGWVASKGATKDRVKLGEGALRWTREKDGKAVVDYELGGGAKLKPESR